MNKISKKIVYLSFLLFTLFLLFPDNVSVNACSNYSVQIATRGGGFTSDTCHSDINAAKTRMNSLTNDINNTPVIKDSSGRIINMSGGIVRTSGVPSNEVISLYNTSTASYPTSYANGGSAGEFGFVDSKLHNNGRIKVIISGRYTWINERNGGVDVYLVPTSHISNIPYYQSENDGKYDRLRHYYTYQRSFLGSGNAVIVGVAPSFMVTGDKYYSWDGIYYYDDFVKLSSDIIDGVNTNAINKDTPYYNYYQYLPTRSKTRYTAYELNTFLESYNYGPSSKLYKAGYYFIKSQEKNGTNAAMEFSWAILESAYGMSAIAQDKNNLFGMGAYDNNPYSGSIPFPSVEVGVEYHSKTYISNGYADALTDGRYYGTHLGNKNSGFNVMYASDPYWGEKIAGRYYNLDKFLGFKDLNYYSIAIKELGNVLNVRYQPDTNQEEGYQTKNGWTDYMITHYPFIITEETPGQDISGDNTWYRIMGDMPIKSSESEVCSKYYYSTQTGTFVTKLFDVELGKVHFSCLYSWDNYMYVARNSSNIIFTNNTDYLKPDDLNLYETNIHDNIWDNNSLVLKGSVIVSGFEMPTASSSTKKILLKNKSGDTVKTYNATNIDEYGIIIDGDDYTYAGFTVNLTGLELLADDEFTTWVEVYDSDDELIHIEQIIDSSFTTTPETQTIGKKGVEVINDDSGYRLKLVEAYITDNVMTYLSDLKWENNNLYIKGIAALKEENHADVSNVKHFLVLESTKDDTVHEIPLVTYTGDYKLDLFDGYDYTYAWYEENIDTSSIPTGDYTLYVKVVVDNTKIGKIEFINSYEGNLPEYTETATRSIKIHKNVYNKLRYELTIENEIIGATPKESLPTDDDAFFYLQELDFDNETNHLNINGYAFMWGVNHSDTDNVSHKLVLINEDGNKEEIILTPWEGLWNNTSIINSGINYDMVWFGSTFEVSEIPSGTYSMYVVIETNDYRQHVEVKDRSTRDFNQSTIINDKEFIIQKNSLARDRYELIVK